MGHCGNLGKTMKLIVVGSLIFGLFFASGCKRQSDRELYNQIKQFDNDVKRGRYTPIATPDGKTRYQKNW